MRVNSKNKTKYVRVPPSGYLPDLIGWLNAANGTGSFEKLMRIREQLLQIQDYAERPNATHRKLLDLEGKLWSLLHVYRFIVRATYTGRGASSSRAHKEWSRNYWAEFPPVGFILRQNSEWGEISISEGDTVSHLLRLAEEGKLKQLRLCAECKKKWVISIRAMDRFCEPACRVQHRLGSEVYKRKQRERMREHRQTLKSRAEAEDRAPRRASAKPAEPKKSAKAAGALRQRRRVT